MNQDQKWGLALSGGGFRAAFFHIGVLAQMAELDVLRKVEVISAVSGGSIVGALYYLYVKRLLESTYDDEITPDRYADIVEEMERHFLDAVQQNIRMRTFANPLKNLRMAFPDYSRSDHIGELYDKYFYRPIFSPRSSEMVQMQHLQIRPCGERPGFSARDGNKTRTNKVPILLINATTLNTGHNWRFAPEWMGEPRYDDEVANEVDKNLRLRRPDYEQIRHTGHDRFELGLAVAASACVPAIFPPLAISNLYPGMRVQLVDGGVHDNLGVQGLRDEKCTHWIVSDASRWLEDQDNPQTRSVPTYTRSMDILMDRVREEELYRLYYDPAKLPFAFMHLRKGLNAKAISWKDKAGKAIERTITERASRVSSQAFGVHPDVQDLLSRIRTDLDSFTEVEAFSLMLDGYKMSGNEIPLRLGVRRAIQSRAWIFLKVEDWAQNPPGIYLEHLKVARKNLFKVFRLSPALAAGTAVVVGLLLVGLWPLVGSWIMNLLSRTVTWGVILLTAGIFVLVTLFPQFDCLRKLLVLTEGITRITMRAVLPALASVFVLIHLAIFDRIFLWLGSVERLRRKAEKARTA
jgi:NTE family protein